MGYNEGTLITLTAVFKDTAGTEADPTTVTFRLKKPDETVIVYVYGTDAELVKDSTGNYSVGYTPDMGGDFIYRWEGTGAVEVAGESTFSATASSF